MLFASGSLKVLSLNGICPVYFTLASLSGLCILGDDA